MLPKINPTTTLAWKKLENHYIEMKKVQMKELFAADNNRFNTMHLQLGDILLDFSKNIITKDTIDLIN